MSKEFVPTNTTPDQHRPEGPDAGSQEAAGEKPNKFQGLLGETAVQAVAKTPETPGTPPKKGKPGSLENPIVVEGGNSQAGLAVLRDGAAKHGVWVAGTVPYGSPAKPTQQPKG